MLLRHAFQLDREAGCIEAAVRNVLEAGHRTQDLARAGQPILGTTQMGQKVVEEFTKLSQTSKWHTAS